MSEPDAPRNPDQPAQTQLGDAEAARLLEVGLTGAEEPARRDAPTPAEMAAHFPELELIEVLGQGGMGVVYRARQRKLDRLVALKVLPRELAQDPAFAERFAREARTLAKLQHAHIVGVHEFGERDGLYFLVMEFVDGVTLRQLMRTGEITPREALAIVPQICEALQYAHDQGVVHRDIKPENILLDRSGRVKVADFGLAKLVERAPGEFTLTGTDQVMGTLHYMAPEQYKTPQEVDHRADIFSLGVVFYEMLTGELPVGRFGKPSEGKDLDARIDDIVMRALERERELRYQQASEVEDDVKTVAEGPPPGPPEARRGPFLSRMRARHDRRAARAAAHLARPISRWTAWALATVLIGIAAGFVVYGLVFSLTDAQAHPGYYGCVAGFWTGIGFGFLAITLAAAAVVRTARARDRFRGLPLAVACLVVAMVGTSGAVSHLAQEIRNHDLRVERDAEREARRVERLLDQQRTAAVAVTGTVPSWQADSIRQSVAATWRTYAQRVRGTHLTVQETTGLYDPADQQRLQAMRGSEFQREWEALRLGMGLVGTANAHLAPEEFQLARIDVHDGGERATVTAFHEDPSVHTTIRFPMHRFVPHVGTGGWVFAIGQVTIER